MRDLVLALEMEIKLHFDHEMYLLEKVKQSGLSAEESDYLTNAMCNHPHAQNNIPSVEMMRKIHDRIKKGKEEVM